ncbi:MAG: ABC transporter ATP-binding protein [Myxococcota bacterium]
MSGDAAFAAAPAGGSRVVADRLSRDFGGRPALRDVSLAIEPGESFGLLGANGAGKTTFIRIVTGYLEPTAGAVAVDGLSPTVDAAAVQARIGYAPENARLHPELGVASYLAFAAGIRGLAGAPRRRAVEAALARFHLEAVARRPIGNLSKGYQQRVSLAQAFLHEPSLLIVDEPTSGLDPLQQDDVRAALAALRGRCTVLLCTHDLAEARALAARVAVLAQGRLVACGPADDVLAGGDPLALFRADAARAVPA